MPGLPIFVSIEAAQEWKALSRRLKDAGRGDLKKKLRKRIRLAGEPVVSDLRQAVRGVEVSSSAGGHARPDRSTNLRERTARATGLSVTQTGIRIRTRGGRVDSDYPNLPKYLDGTIGNYDRWRHPVFRKTVWTQQSGQPWFNKTIEGHRRVFRRAVFDAMRDVADDIAD